MTRRFLGYEDMKQDKLEYARSFYTQYCNTDPFAGKRLVEPYNDHLYVVQNPPALPLSEGEMDDVYGLPYMRTYHPSYETAGGVPAISRDQIQSDQQQWAALAAAASVHLLSIREGSCR